MQETEKLQKLFEPVLKEMGIQLYDLKWTGSKKDNLEVSIIKEDGSMDLDTCASASEKLSEILDREDPVAGAYTLEVCSPGAEREIRSEAELSKIDRPYVYVRLKHAVKKKTEFTGEITSMENGNIVLEYREKAAKRKAEFPWSEIEYIRLAVKI